MSRAAVAVSIAAGLVSSCTDSHEGRDRYLRFKADFAQLGDTQDLMTTYNPEGGETSLIAEEAQCRVELNALNRFRRQIADDAPTRAIFNVGVAYYKAAFHLTEPCASGSAKTGDRFVPILRKAARKLDAAMAAADLRYDVR